MHLLFAIAFCVTKSAEMIDESDTGKEATGARNPPGKSSKNPKSRVWSREKTATQAMPREKDPTNRGRTGQLSGKSTAVRRSPVWDPRRRLQAKFTKIAN